MRSIQNHRSHAATAGWARTKPKVTARYDQGRYQLTFPCFWCSMRISASCGYSVPSKRLKS
jgi:hypothetical protein